MSFDTQIPIPSGNASRRFANRLALFYGAVFTLIGTHLPFFPLWLRSVGIEPSWIGIITAVPAVTRFTVLPWVAGLAERRSALRGAMIVTAIMTTLGFSVVGTQARAPLVFLAYVVTASVWTPMIPLTDAYALRGAARYGLKYGPLRLWGSAAFVVGALVCGLLVDIIAWQHLIWVIAATAAQGAVLSLGLQPLDGSGKQPAAHHGASALLRDPRFLVIILASALIQGSHAAYYTFASITWELSGLSGLTIAVLWALGVIAEIVVFAISPHLKWQPAVLVVIGALSAVARWLITAQEPPVAVLAIVQLAHGLTFGITQVGTMGLMLRHVPLHFMARGQGYLAACHGIVASGASILSGAIFARHGQGVYYVMAAMALLGAAVMWSARDRMAFSGSTGTGWRKALD
jgi:MFS transporter, PPP family, 3-phenylpropionic acid transporter